MNLIQRFKTWRDVARAEKLAKSYDDGFRWAADKLLRGSTGDDIGAFLENSWHQSPNADEFDNGARAAVCAWSQMQQELLCEAMQDNEVNTAELRLEIAELRKALELRSQTSHGELQQYDALLTDALGSNHQLGRTIRSLKTVIRSGDDRLGPWLSAALEDGQTCDELKVEIRRWMDLNALALMEGTK